MKLKFIKLFEEFEPLLSPDIANMDIEKFNRRKPDVEFDNKSKTDKEWLLNHPLVGVKLRDKELIPTETRWYMNESGSYGYSVNFQGDYYISFYTESKTPTNMIYTIRVGYSGIEGKEELISWIHSNMIYHNVPHMLKEKMLKKIDEEIKEKDPHSNF
jgi:hypothetical protein